MKLSGLLLLLTIFTVTLATPLNLLTHSSLCGDECTVTCGPCTCVFGCCTDTPHCSKVIKPCTETCRMRIHASAFSAKRRSTDAPNAFKDAITTSYRTRIATGL